MYLFLSHKLCYESPMDSRFLVRGLIIAFFPPSGWLNLWYCRWVHRDLCCLLVWFLCFLLGVVSCVVFCLFWGKDLPIAWTDLEVASAPKCSEYRCELPHLAPGYCFCLLIVFFSHGIFSRFKFHMIFEDCQESNFCLACDIDCLGAHFSEAPRVLPVPY